MLRPTTFGLAALCLLFGACEPEATRSENANYLLPADLPVILGKSMSVSGLGAGAFMASQMHLAFSDRISGIGIVGGGLYFCSQGNIEQANGPCRSGGRLDLQELTHEARDQAAAGQLATLNHLKGMRLWALHGSNDDTYAPDTTYAAVEFYETLADPIESRFDDQLPVGHGLPTMFEGHQCERTESPFLNACDFDGAGEMLKFLLSSDKVAEDRATGVLHTISDPADTDRVAAYLYAPSSCPNGHCRLHVAFHDCQQSSREVGDRFARDAGYNRWADALGLAVVYPQATANDGCWDWYGRTGANYATRDGKEIIKVAALLGQLTGTALN